MNTFYLVLFIIWYFLILFVFYTLVFKRLRYLTDKHIEYTKVEWINNSYNSLKKIILILIIVQFLLSVFIILTFL